MCVCGGGGGGIVNLDVLFDLDPLPTVPSLWNLDIPFDPLEWPFALCCLSLFLQVLVASVMYISCCSRGTKFGIPLYTLVLSFFFFFCL